MFMVAGSDDATPMLKPVPAPKRVMMLLLLLLLL